MKEIKIEEVRQAFQYVKDKFCQYDRDLLRNDLKTLSQFITDVEELIKENENLKESLNRALQTLQFADDSGSLEKYNALIKENEKLKKELQSYKNIHWKQESVETK